MQLINPGDAGFGIVAAIACLLLFLVPLAQAQEASPVPPEGAAPEATAAPEEGLVEDAPAAPVTTIERIRATGTIRLGYRTDAAPFSYGDAPGQPGGYSVALCGNIAEQIKTKLELDSLAIEWVLVSLESRFSDLRDGKVDLLCGADTVTLKRREEVSFSIPVFPGGIGALVRSDSPATLQTVLEGRPLPGFVVWRGYPAQILHRKTFSAVAGSTAEPWLTERIATLGIPSKAVPVGTYDEGVASVLDRSSDVLFGDRAILLEAAAKNAAAGDLKVLDRHFTFESIALGVPRGDDDFRLLVDRTLNALYPTEAFAEIWEATFGEPDDRALLFFRANILPE